MFQTTARLQATFKSQELRPVVYLEHMSRDTLGVGRSHLGWMNFQDNRVFQDIDENPINFKYILDVFSLDEYKKKVIASGEPMDGPRVVVTSAASFRQGFTRKLFREFVSRSKNEVLFLQLLGEDCLGSKLLFETEVVPPEDCSVMAVLDDVGESDSSYIGAQRRDSDYQPSP